MQNRTSSPSPFTPHTFNIHPHVQLFVVTKLSPNGTYTSSSDGLELDVVTSLRVWTLWATASRFLVHIVSATANRRRRPLNSLRPHRSTIKQCPPTQQHALHPARPTTTPLAAGLPLRPWPACIARWRLATASERRLQSHPLTQPDDQHAHSRSTLKRMYNTLPASLRHPATSSEGQLLEHVQTYHTERRQQQNKWVVQSIHCSAVLADSA